MKGNIVLKISPIVINEYVFVLMGNTLIIHLPGIYCEEKPVIRKIKITL